jgi:hypothetical protein
MKNLKIGDLRKQLSSILASSGIGNEELYKGLYLLKSGNMSKYYDTCFISGCTNLTSRRIKVSSRNKEGKFTSVCEIIFLCETHYKNIGRMQMKSDIPVVIEDWDS